MLPADFPFELRTRPPAAPMPQWRRVVAVAIALIVHLGLLMRLLAVPEPMSALPRHASAEAPALQVYLLEPAAPTAAVEIPVLIVMAPVPAHAPPAPTQAQPALKASRPATPIAADAPISAAQLFGGIEGAARDLTASDRPLPGAGMPSALAQLPGRAEPIVDLPVRFKRRPTPQQIALFAARMLIGTMASNPDDLEQVRTMRNPLQDLTDAHIGGIKEPECNHPDDPLRDPRCYPAPPR